jgi:poly(hydroxyalkanoate) depolymerase family esterase
MRWLVLVLLAVGCGTAPRPDDATWRTVDGLRYRLHIPAGLAGAAPMVVLLHGCEQDPDDFARGTRMDTLADTNGFVALYPEQPASENTLRCWNWFDPANQARGAGEPMIIADMVTDAGSLAPASRVYAAGLSAGGALAVILGATYPDVFSAIAVHSGLEYAAASDATSALEAMASSGPPPDAQAAAATAAMGTFARSVPVLVLHGDADRTVAPANGLQVATQWAITDGFTATPTAMETDQAGGRSVRRSTWGTTVELDQIADLGHAWSGGDPSGTYTDPAGPDASALIWAFFSTR